MDTFKQLLENADQMASQNSTNDTFSLSNYFELFGYSDKHTFVRYLKSKNYNVHEGQCMVKQRKGKDFYMYASSFFNLLCDHFQDNAEFQQALSDLFYIKYKKKIYRFRNTSKKVKRSVFYTDIYAEGIFYNYSLNTLSLANEIGICPYDCYKYSNRYFIGTFQSTGLDYDTKIPVFYFDSKQNSDRMRFITLINNIIEAFHITATQKCKIIAYKTVVMEMLTKQRELDNLIIQELIKEKEQEEERLKTAYRDACKLYHPDVNKSEEAEDIMKQINAFYENKDYTSIKFLIDKCAKTV